MQAIHSISRYEEPTTTLKNNKGPDFLLEFASAKHTGYIKSVTAYIEEAAKVKGTGIAKRSPGYIREKMLEEKAIIALQGTTFAGFCYIESWGHERFVANSGLIVARQFRGLGLAKAIKRKAFALSRKKFPHAKLFGLTTNLAVMRINSSLGYVPVTFSELTDDAAFWEGCAGCAYVDILKRTNRSHCLCTGMLYDPQWETKDQTPATNGKRKNSSKYTHLLRWKRRKR